MGMRVKFTTQILNEPVGKVLDRFGHMATFETADYCNIFDYFF